MRYRYESENMAVRLFVRNENDVADAAEGLVRRGFDHVDGREGGLAIRLGMNNVGAVGSESTY